MEEVFNVIGKIVVFLTSGVSLIFLCWLLMFWIIEKAAKFFSSMWIIVEWAYYRKQFKSWMKDNKKKSVTGRFKD